MVGAFPVFKLGSLALKQISKPIANFIKQRAKTNPLFRKYVCLPSAQCLSKPKEIRKLDEDAASDLGAEMLGELLIFVSGVAILGFEYKRQAGKEAAKEENMRNTFDSYESQINQLTTLLEIQDARIKELTRLFANIDSK